MRYFLMIALAAILLSGCGSGSDGGASDSAEAVSDSELRRDSRKRLLEGRDMLPKELEALGQDFAEKISNMTLNEAKQCRVSLYTESQHFKLGYPSGFDVDFREADRDKERVQFLAFLYYGVDEIVQEQEREAEVKNVSDAPQSVQRQILREGKFHKTVESLARCKVELMTLEDTELPYHKLFCSGSTKQEQNVYRRRINNMQAYCEALGREYLETGRIKRDSYDKSPMVFK